MSVRLVVKNSSPASVSPYRLLDERNREITWANQFLDAQTVRQLSLRSLRAYAYDLLHLARWFDHTRHSLHRLNQSLLLDYVRHQLEHQPIACVCCAACIASITHRRFPANRSFSVGIPRALLSATAAAKPRLRPTCDCDSRAA